MKPIVDRDPGDETKEIWIHPSLMEKTPKKKPLIATEEQGLEKQLKAE